MADAARDGNFVPTLLGVSSSDGATPVKVYVNPSTHRLLVDLSGGGSGTVTSVSVVSANGFAGTVATETTTPAITLSTTITGLLKGNATAMSAASPSTDYAALAFKTIAVSGQSDVVADSPIDTLTLVGSGVTITTDAATDTITFTAGAAALTVGATTIASGTTTRILYDNAGTLGEYTITGTGTVVAMATSPVFTTPNIGAATATSINGLTVTASTGVLTIANGKTATLNASTTFAGTDGKTLTISNSGTLAGGDAFVLAIAAGKTLTVSNTLTFTGTDSSTVAFGAGGTVLYTSSTIPLTVGTTTITSGTDTRILYNNSGVLGEYTLTGTGTVVVMATSPTLTTPNISGAAQLAEGASIRLDPVLSADGTYTGTTITGTAGTTLAFGDLVYLAVADSRWELADASAVSTGAQLTGFCVLAAAADGDPTVILLDGNIRADTAFPSLTVGAPVYMSETSGDVTNTAPTTTDSVTRVLGYGLTADSMILRISPDWITHT